MTLLPSLQQTLTALERVPAWLRPAAYAPLLLLYIVMLRGGVVLFPILLVLLLVRGPAFLPEVEKGASIVVYAVIAAIVSGLTYGIIGRPLRSIPLLGRYLAGVVATAPYVAGVAATLHWEESGSLLEPWDTGDWIIFAFTSLLFGFIIGHSWFAPESRDDQVGT
jgi:hypothetical protein